MGKNKKRKRPSGFSRRNPTGVAGAAASSKDDAADETELMRASPAIAHIRSIQALLANDEGDSDEEDSDDYERVVEER
jgi:hypothetical protein